MATPNVARRIARGQPAVQAGVMPPNVRRAFTGRKSGWALWLGLVACTSEPARDDGTVYLAEQVVGAPAGTTALLVRDGRIVATGDSTLVDDPHAAGAEVLAFRGAAITPPLVDHHVHLFNVGLTLLNDRDRERLFLDLSRSRSLDDVRAAVAARAAATPKGGWIIGAGWNQAAWGLGPLPDRTILDAAAPDHPVYLGRSDGHAGWANGRALAAGGVEPSTASPMGGTIGHARDGTPDGVLLERANELLTPLVPVLADSDVVRAWQLAARALAERGVTRVYDAGVLPLPGVVAMNAPFERYLTLLRRTDSLAPLPLQVHLMLPAPSPFADSVLSLPPDPARWTWSPRIRVTHIKLFVDGALGSRGAALSHPYADDAATHGVPRMTVEEIRSTAARALDAGLGVATHAIGDDAVRRTLDAYEQLLTQRPGTTPGRLRIEHFSYASARDMERAVRLGVVLSIQGNFNAMPTDVPTFGSARVGAVNEPRVYPWRRLREMGAVLADGSDYFTRPGSALAGLLASMERRYAVGDGLPDVEARARALELATRWFAPSGESQLPQLKSGEPATFVVWSGHPLRVARDSIERITVRALVVDGVRQ